jgi:vacuolar-type H+-ATPase subunit I/STV1
MISYEWDCRTVWVYNEYEGLENVVYKVQYILNGVSDELDAEGNPYKSRRAGVIVIQDENLGKASQLSEFKNSKSQDSIAKQYLEEEKIEQLKADIEEDINSQMNPTSFSYVLPDVSDVIENAKN